MLGFISDESQSRGSPNHGAPGTYKVLVDRVGGHLLLGEFVLTMQLQAAFEQSELKFPHAVSRSGIFKVESNETWHVVLAYLRCALFNTQ